MRVPVAELLSGSSIGMCCLSEASTQGQGVDGIPSGCVTVVLFAAGGVDHVDA